MKKIIAVLLAAVLLLGMIPTALAGAGMENFRPLQTYADGQFTDVKDSDWFAAGVKSAYELGLMNGSGSAFKPAGNLTVAEALAIACRLHSIYADNGQQFTQGNPWYQVYVDYAVAKGIMLAGLLTPTAQISREQFAYLMYNSLPSNELNTINRIPEGSLPDVKSEGDYWWFVYRLYDAGVLTGSDKYGTFKPTTAIQRSEVATIATRMADKSQRKKFKLEEAIVTEVQLAGRTSIKVGESTTWTAKAFPEGVPTTITWVAGNPSVATVDANGNISSHKAGQCDITAIAENGVSKTVWLTVGEIDVTEIQLAGKVQIGVGEKTTWTATTLPVLPTGASTSITWSAGNPRVASVNENGEIVGLATGQCHITATASNGVKKTVLLTVSGGFPLEIVEVKVSESIIGTPELHVIIKNTGSVAVDAFEFYSLVYDAYGDPVYYWGIGTNEYTGTWSESERDALKPGHKTSEKTYWSYIGFDNVKNVSITLRKAHTVDGHTYELPKDCYNWRHFGW